ncbi:hypothetical protein AYO40_03980 [Planctomycetaceae bacterium SCGC AG-212-D15]|nr:hypothetical protein AYO40_03980 [Planctomycetaceae bacterium SCGC AG-212-D15]
MIEIKWTDTDPDTGERRFLLADRFAGVWRFQWKLQRRAPWEGELKPTLPMWEHVLDSLHRRYRRRQGVDYEDIEQVEAIVRDIRRRLEANG